MTPEIYTVDSLAERWMCSRMTIYRLVESGKLKSFKLGQAVRIPREVVERYERGEQ